MSFISMDSVSLSFRSYRNSNPTLKQKIVGMLNGRFGEEEHETFEALKRVSLHLSDGDRLAIVGGNGAGKSTLLRVMCGIYPPCEGEIRGEGKLIPLLELGTGFDVTRTVRENIYLCGATLGYSKSEMTMKIGEILDFAEMEDFIDAPVATLSSGMKSRIAFSIATAVQPDILILDEVFAAGDARFISKARRRMEGLIDNCKILVFVSHSEEHLRSMCNRAIYLEHGEIKLEGSVDFVIDHYNKNFVEKIG
ncbi:ABC transporter ATP-binding protein [Craterilacuibacter sp. RT1T]|uniref:ABC transporter ATP-binding protein n=1 Tax=Craterilacuibacter sp. RT1T TaxID=2942211 RepID=UPI0020C12B99|nr:ABC transporter ATP-binding protein [Craterilacuibacter sp. RT1T]MCL6263674.1 ABC transporter ATP-binding protein [Craterilacuibacter sp. RT1T]